MRGMSLIACWCTAFAFVLATWVNPRLQVESEQSLRRQIKELQEQLAIALEEGMQQQHENAAVDRDAPGADSQSDERQQEVAALQSELQQMQATAEELRQELQSERRALQQEQELSQRLQTQVEQSEASATASAASNTEKEGLEQAFKEAQCMHEREMAEVREQLASAQRDAAAQQNKMRSDQTVLAKEVKKLRCSLAAVKEENEGLRQEKRQWADLKGALEEDCARLHGLLADRTAHAESLECQVAQLQGQQDVPKAGVSTSAHPDRPNSPVKGVTTSNALHAEAPAVGSPALGAVAPGSNGAVANDGSHPAADESFEAGTRRPESKSQPADSENCNLAQSEHGKNANEPADSTPDGTLVAVESDSESASILALVKHQLSTVRQEASEHLAAKQADVSELRQELATSEERLRAAQVAAAEFEAVNGRLERASEENAALKDRLTTAELETEQLQQRLQSAEAVLSGQSYELAAATEAAAGAQVLQLQEQLLAVEKAAEASGSALQAELQAAQLQIEDLQHQLQAAQQQAAANQSPNASDHTSDPQNSTRPGHSEAEVADLQQALAVAQQRSASLEAAVEASETRLRELQAEGGGGPQPPPPQQQQETEEVAELQQALAITQQRLEEAEASEAQLRQMQVESGGSGSQQRQQLEDLGAELQAAQQAVEEVLKDNQDMERQLIASEEALLRLQQIKALVHQVYHQTRLPSSSGLAASAASVIDAPPGAGVTIPPAATRPASTSSAATGSLIDLIDFGDDDSHQPPSTDEVVLAGQPALDQDSVQQLQLVLEHLRSGFLTSPRSGASCSDSAAGGFGPQAPAANQQLADGVGDASCDWVVSLVRQVDSLLVHIKQCDASAIGGVDGLRSGSDDSDAGDALQQLLAQNEQLNQAMQGVQALIEDESAHLQLCSIAFYVTRLHSNQAAHARNVGKRLVGQQLKFDANAEILSE